MSATVAEHEQILSPQPVFQALQGFQVTAVLGTAIRLGVFDMIAAGQTSADTLATAVGADPRGLAILLDALAALGFLLADGGGYRLSPVSEAFLVRDGGAYIGGLADVFYSDWHWRGYLELPDAVRLGGTASAEQNVELPEHPFWATFVHAWTGVSYPSAQATAAVLAPWAASRRPLEILDVACGSGIYGATLAGRHEDAHVTFLDWPLVLKDTRGYAEQFGVAARARYLEGDMFTTPLGGPYDIALASHVFHHFAPERCVELLRRIERALKPGGRIAIHDFILTTTPAQEPAAALFAVIMLVHTRRGKVYSLDEYEAMLAQAGFGEPEPHEITGLPTRILVATAGRKQDI